MENKKTTPIIIIIAIIILALIILIIVKNPNKKNYEIAPSPTEIELTESMNQDTTSNIKTSLDKIDMTDTTEEDLKAIDEELKNL